MKALLFLASLVFSGIHVSAQQQADVISFTAPKGWQQQQSEGGVQLSISDKKNGTYAIALITKATTSVATAYENFNIEWNKLVKGSVQVQSAPAMSDPVKENGWEIISGTASYKDGTQKGVATLLTATAGGQMASAVIMTNTDKYEQELLAFINSLKLPKPAAVSNKNQSVSASPDNKNIIGLWSYNILETSGYYNNIPQYSGGYIRREYAFYADGSYLFRTKIWSTSVKDILYVYEAGSYNINGNQLTVTPQKGKGEWWSKKDNNTTKWGKLVKASTFKLEKTSYKFQIKYFSGSNNYVLILLPAKDTERDGGLTSEGYSYSFDEDGTSLIDNPPGFKTGFENKSFSVNIKNNNPATANNNTKVANTTIHSSVTGKIWEAHILEKHGASYGSMSGFHTGGFWKYQYKFNADGTYHFIYNAASAVATNPVNILQYEKGTYAINGNSIIIMPESGTNEEWSVGKINNGMSAETIRKVLETRIKRLKTTARKMEKITYPFTVEYWKGNEANTLCLKHVQKTIREGSPGQNNQRCFFETTAAKAENFSMLFK